MLIKQKKQLRPAILEALNHYERHPLDPLNGKYYTDFARSARHVSKVEPGNVNSPLYKQAINEAHLAESLAWNDYKTWSPGRYLSPSAGEEEMIRVGSALSNSTPGWFPL
jgi:hypothetical protein